ncbi:MAG: hypothetical protein PHE50_06835 [Dehalococcoidales bacterium]|nr:hypothetical protein [Dehalococcoidales bacterium]
MSDIKSAFEIAMEKANKIEAATPEEKMQWKFKPQGEQIAAKYLKDDINLLAEVSKFKDEERVYVTQGAVEVLVRGIDLPRNEIVKKTTRKAMDGIKLLKKDKTNVENVFNKIRYILNHFTNEGEQQKKQAYEQVKMQFAAKLQQALQQQRGANAQMDMSNIDIERHPQFQEEWRRVIAQMESQYLEHLNDYRRELVELQ